jgi:release factor glutamine methyltransferase
MSTESDAPPTCGAQLARAEQILAAMGLATAHDDALALLDALLGVPASLLLANPTTPMRREEVETYEHWVTRRSAGEAIAYITGRLAFMGLSLMVDAATPLIPAGAEQLVAVALDCARHHAPAELAAAEIGTGCGAVALALAAFEPRFTRVYALDPSEEVLRTAAANGLRYQLNLVISWQQGDGLDALPEPVDLIVWSGISGEVPAGGARGGDLAPVTPDEMALPTPFSQLVAVAPARLRPGGTLVGTLASRQEPAAMRLLARTLPDARLWTVPSDGGTCVAVAQLPANPPDRAGDTAFETER